MDPKLDSKSIAATTEVDVYQMMWMFGGQPLSQSKRIRSLSDCEGSQIPSRVIVGSLNAKLAISSLRMKTTPG